MHLIGARHIVAKTSATSPVERIIAPNTAIALDFAPARLIVSPERMR